MSVREAGLHQHSQLIRGGGSVIVTVYNGSETLAELAARVEAVMSATGLSFEILFINNGSSNDSWQTLQQLVEARPFVRAVDLMPNFGQHNAILCGLHLAR